MDSVDNKPQEKVVEKEIEKPEKSEKSNEIEHSKGKLNDLNCAIIVFDWKQTWPQNARCLITICRLSRNLIVIVFFVVGKCIVIDGEMNWKIADKHLNPHLNSDNNILCSFITFH